MSEPHDSEHQDLRARPLQPPAPDELPPFQPAGALDHVKVLISAGLSCFVRNHLARHYLAPLRARDPARFALVGGPSGEGKSFGIAKTCSDAGVDLVSRTAAELAGSTEDGAGRAFAKLLADVERVRRDRGLQVAVLLDDADLSVFTARERTEYAISRDVLIGRLQRFADAVGAGPPLPVFVTVNELVFRASLFRPGRAIHYEHAPTPAEKVDQVAFLLGAEDAADRRLVGELVARFADQPIAFFAGLRAAALDDITTAVTSEIGVTGRFAEEVVAERLAALTVADFAAAADTHAHTLARSYLSGDRS